MFDDYLKESAGQNHQITSLVILGSACLWAIVFLCAFGVTLTPRDVFSNDQIGLSKMLYLFGIFVTLFFLKQAALRLIQMKNYRRRLATISVAVLCVAVLCMQLVEVLDATRWITVGLFALCGFFHAVCTTVWAEALCFAEMQNASVVTGASVSCGAVIYIASSVFLPQGIKFILIAASLLTLFCLTIVCRAHPNVVVRTKVLSRKQTKAMLKGNITLIVFGSVFGVGIYANYACLPASMPLEICCALTGLALFLGALLHWLSGLSGRNYSLGEIALAILPFVALALLSLLFAQGTLRWLIYLAVLIPLTLFDITSFVSDKKFSEAYDINPFAAISSSRTCIQGGILFGGIIFYIFSLIPFESGDLSFLAPLVMVFFLFVMITTSGELSSPLLMSQEKLSDVGLREKPKSITEYIIADYDLTTREAEVLDLLLSGNTIASVSEKLFISPNTTKTHIHHIYRKMGIGSKGELIKIRDNYHHERFALQETERRS